MDLQITALTDTVSGVQVRSHWNNVSAPISVHLPVSLVDSGCARFEGYISLSQTGLHFSSSASTPSRSACQAPSEAKGFSELDLGPGGAAQPPQYQSTQMLCLSITQLIFFFPCGLQKVLLITAGEARKDCHSSLHPASNLGSSKCDGARMPAAKP